MEKHKSIILVNILLLITVAIVVWYLGYVLGLKTGQTDLAKTNVTPVDFSQTEKLPEVPPLILPDNSQVQILNQNLPSVVPPMQ